MVSETLKNAPGFLAPVAVLYDQEVRRYGARARSVYWSSEDNQTRRFEIFTGLLGEDAASGGFSINDLGCGYGALHAFLAGLNMKSRFRYFGYDISEEMIATARARIADPNARLYQALTAFREADYSVASGTFSLSIDTSAAPWEAYIKASLIDLWAHTRRGMAFNILDFGSKPEGSGLYTAKPDAYVDFCRTELSGNVELLDDDDLPDWTIFVRR